jgi:hypothetical protein
MGAERDLRVNDFVFHPSGEAICVLGISEKWPTCVRVEFSNGDVIYTHERHDWTVIACRHRHSGKLTKPTITLETHELMRLALSDGEIGRRGHHYQYQLPRVRPMHGSWQALPLAPYALGVWLGNGTRGQTRITQQVGDEAVIEAIEELGYVVSTKNEWTQVTGTKATHFSFADYAQSNCSFVEGLRPFGFMQQGCEKFIPDQYLVATLVDRLELLAGLIDTDGSVHHPTGRVFFCTADESLMLTFKRLIATFGWHASAVEHPPRGFAGGELGPSGGQDYYNVGFSPTLKRPCRLPRKQLKRVFDKAALMPVAIKSVTFDDRGEVGRCITVDSPDGLSLVGETMQPTHNSTAAEDFALWMAGRQPDWRIIYSSYSEGLGTRMNLSLQRTMTSRRYREVFPHMMIGVPGWIANTGLMGVARR